MYGVIIKVCLAAAVNLTLLYKPNSSLGLSSGDVVLVFLDTLDLQSKSHPLIGLFFVMKHDVILDV